MAGNQVTGRVIITVAGRRLKTKEGSTLRNPEGITREGVAADIGVGGFQEATAIPEVECVIIHDGNTSIMDLAGITDATLSFDADSGKSYVLTGAFYCAGSELSKEELKAKFQSMQCEEVK